MSQVTDPILLDSTGQDMVTQLAAISARLAAGLPGAYAGNPAMDGTASPGSSTLWARGDHVHPKDTSKQDVLTFDTTPSSGSSNPVTSGGIYDAIKDRIKVNRQVLSNTITTGLNSLSVAPTSIAGYTPIGVVGVQFAAVQRASIRLIEFLLDSTVVTLQFSSDTAFSSVGVAAFVLYVKN